MSNNNVISETGEELDELVARRVLIVTNYARAAFQTQLASAGYETLATTTGMALTASAEFEPDILLLELGNEEGAEESDQFTLVRQLRAKAATHALPIVLVFDQDGSALRQTALNFGVDDYFGTATPFPEVKARLEGLFWRVEAGRRAAAVAGNRRLEIENFLLLLDAVREDSSAGLQGSLAVLRISNRGWVSPPARGAATRGGILKKLFGFLKLHLRRLDSVAFYGPDALITYLPGLNAAAAAEALSTIRKIFVQDYEGTDITIGLASFPADSVDVEKLLERCEAEAQGAPPKSVTNPRAHSVESEHLELVVSEDKNAPAPQEQIGSSPLHEGASDLQDKRETSTRRFVPGRIDRAEQPNLSRRVLLVVSDAQRMAKLNSQLRSAGYEVRAAFDGEQALNLLRIERPGLVVLDSDLHKLDGVEIVRRLWKQGGGTLATPVLFLNSLGDQGVSEEARAFGVRKILVAPFDSGELLASVENLVNNR
ncbi:MAG: response regulator [Pyrinomonadaceae bacterium]